MNKIALTVRQLLLATESVPGQPSALQKFFQCSKPTTVSWANRKLIASCNETIKLYHEHRLELCKKHGTLDPKTNNFVFENPTVAQLFNQELATLQDQAVELDGAKVKISDLGGSLSEIDMSLLEPFITD
jgi:hypothetical protein